MPPKAESVEARVLEFVNEQNKPVNAQLVADALQKYGMKKTAAQKALDTLSESGAITFKDYGKQRIYLARQDQFVVPTSEELESMKAEVDTLQNEVKVAKTAAQEAEAELKAMKSSLTMEQIRARSHTLQEECLAMDQKLEVLKTGTVLVDPQERRQVEQMYERYITAWRRRKRIYKDLWDTFTEQFDKARTSSLMEELGIETDADAGQVLDQHENHVMKKRRIGLGG